MSCQNLASLRSKHSLSLFGTNRERVRVRVQSVA
jgi:hypothetical protein